MDFECIVNATEHKTEDGKKYYTVQQEFGHLLMAIEDFIHCIQTHQPDAEEA